MDQQEAKQIDMESKQKPMEQKPIFVCPKCKLEFDPSTFHLDVKPKFNDPETDKKVLVLMKRPATLSFACAKCRKEMVPKPHVVVPNKKIVVPG